MTARFLAAFAGVAMAAVFCGCRGPEEPAPRPEQVLDFKILIADNCAGCHGIEGTHGAARPLNDALYQALTNKDALRQTISSGRPGTPMPAFAKSAGGSLTDQQVEVLVDGMQTQWAKPTEFASAALPAYRATEPGDANRGAAVYQTYCARCHGPEGRGGANAASIVDASFLALASDQGLRTSVIAGRSDMSVPDWRSDVPGQPMKPQEISDVVAWLIAHRTPAATLSAEASR